MSVLALTLLVGSGTAEASYYFFFGDHNANWPGYGNMGDENGIPIFPGTPGTDPVLNNLAGVVAVDGTNNRLQSISINYERGGLYPSLWSLLKPGDLFLDIDGDDGWDYVVRSPVAANGSYSAVDNVLAAGQWTVYALSSDLSLTDPNAYMLAKETQTRGGGSWSGYTIRGYHPWALDEAWLNANGTYAGTIYFSGWQDPDAFTGTATNGWDTAGWCQFDFENANVDFDPLLMDKLIFSFTVNCANDVLYETIPLQEPTGDTVPEPCSLLIWGMLGLSFAGGSWRLAFRRRWNDWQMEE
ncbi:MAG: hypothetical protein JW818_20910 [Pirellulales bacterium]|nr:hypothetical protein [Pirellulales bacterium]